MGEYSSFADSTRSNERSFRAAKPKVARPDALLIGLAYTHIVTPPDKGKP
jgi:hypothetical protein